MKGERMTVLELEEELERDAGGTCRRELMERLSGYMAGIRRSMDSGQSPAAFEKMEKLKAAVEASGRVVESAWKDFHE